MSELKPCPCCGSADISIKVTLDDGVYTHCNYCGLRNDINYTGDDRHKDYQDACTQKQEIIADGIEFLKARIKELENIIKIERDSHVEVRDVINKAINVLSKAYK